MIIVAIDQGTTSTRAFVLGGKGQGIGNGRIVFRRSHQQYYPEPGWVEHDPEEILSHIQKCLQECLNAFGPVDGIGLGNQGESCLAWDRKTGRAISPIIVWQDRRTLPKLAQLKEEGAELLVLERAGLPLDAYFSGSKLGWIIERLPEAKALLLQNRLCLGTSDAFFLHRLTGRYVTDVTTASRTSLMNLETCTWDTELCDLFGVPIAALPEIVPTTSDFGTAIIAGNPVPVTASVVDQQGALFGHGCRLPGEAKFTFGTGGFMQAVCGARPAYSQGCKVLPTLAWQTSGQPATYALEGGVFCAGSAINWARSLGLFKEFDEINCFEGLSAIERGLVFVPALSGLGCPYWDRDAAGAWFGLCLETTPKDMMQAVVEGIALRAAQVVDALGEKISLNGRISIDGGLSANRYFAQFFADASQKTILVQETPELTSLGVAQLAYLGLGEEFPVSPTSSGTKVYRPGKKLLAGRELFEKAVAQTMGWRL